MTHADTRRPLAVELFCGTFGWSHGWLARGGRAVGFDIEHLPHHGPVPEGASLVLQDVRTLDGAQLRDASLILASPPCQEFSWRAMPWKKAREAPPPELGMELFATCFRIQREASAATGRHIPLVVENVRGAQKWVGRAPYHFGSFYLWGDVPALMPKPHKDARKVGGDWFGPGADCSPMRRCSGTEGTKVGGLDWNKRVPGQAFNTHAERHISVAVEGMKQPGISGTRENGKGDAWFQDGAARHGSKSSARKAASALIARIPERLSDWIAEVYYPTEDAR